ncbi:MAG: hypothetical protein HWN67_20620 [Candidatus Helarchaeota archaeon]|nr:hypothetical protein [Candidatus Helarchaeota archaeon]
MSDEKRMTYGDLPDTLITKPYFPLSRHIWRLYQELGYEDMIEEALPNLSTEMLYDIFKARLDESILTAKDVLDGTIKNPDKRLAWMIFPPVLPLRSDLTQGTMKLLYGDSLDMTFYALADLDQELIFLLNGHIENGVPVDWWVVGPEDDLLERRHLKYGFKLKDAFKHSKDMTKCGLEVIDILRDVRNERTPQWATAPYSVCTVWVSGIAGFLVEPSMFELIGMIWDGVATKRAYGLPDHWFAYIPWPSMIKMLLYMKREDFILRMAGLLSSNRLCLNHIEQEMQDIGREVLEGTDFWEKAFVDTWKTGFPWPVQSLGAKGPNLKKKSTYAKEEFDWKYPKGRWINPDDLNMTVEEMTKGILFDITHKTKPWSLEPKDEIVSIGWGREIEVFKDIRL